MPNAIVILLIFPFEVCVASSALNKVFFALGRNMVLNRLLLELSLTMRARKLCFVTVLKMVPYFVTAELLFTIHAFNFSERTFFLNVFHYEVSVKLSFATSICIRAVDDLELAINFLVQL